MCGATLWLCYVFLGKTTFEAQPWNEHSKPKYMYSEIRDSTGSESVKIIDSMLTVQKL